MTRLTKKNFDELYVGNNIIVNCKTKQLANEFLLESSNHGYIQLAPLDKHSEAHYFRILFGMLVSLNSGVVELEGLGFKILEFEGFDKIACSLSLAELDYSSTNWYQDQDYETYKIDSNGILRWAYGTEQPVKITGRILSTKFKQIPNPNKLTFSEAMGLAMSGEWVRFGNVSYSFIDGHLCSMLCHNPIITKAMVEGDWYRA